MRIKLLILWLLMSLFLFSQPKLKPSRQDLINLLGKMPKKPGLKVDTLEKIYLDGGIRYKIRFLAELRDKFLETPNDSIEAYLFVPQHIMGQKMPAIIAIHQDGSHNFYGKLETAGIMGDKEQYYGYELFKRGYVVICPDRFLHAKRRWISKPDTLADLWEEETRMFCEHRGGQLFLKGRNGAGKETYDLTLSMDILYTINFVDKNNIGAIGFSAGGYFLTYYMFYDTRVKCGVSACGVFELSDFFKQKEKMKRFAFNAIPNFLNVARTSDFLGYISPRPFLMTRGLWEWGMGDEVDEYYSKKHVKGTETLASEAGKYYTIKGAEKNLKTIYFDEEGGNHSIPPKVKVEIFNWLDSNLKK